MWTAFLLACSVAADATAVSIAASVRGVTLRIGLAMALAFGIAQAVMTYIGRAGGGMFEEMWSAWDHWIALVLLTAVGLKMIREAFAKEEHRAPIVAGFVSIATLAVATSLDALAVGVSLPSLDVPELLAIAMIGIVTFLFCAAGALLGRSLGARFGRAIEVAGGVGLIAIGVRIVMAHTA